MSLKSQRMPFSRREVQPIVSSTCRAGRAKLTVLSERGKEATISLIAPGEFIGEESIASVPGLRLATAAAVTACTALRISAMR